jgi:hypothetical protein
MEENYLHFIWKSKRFNTANLQLIDGIDIEILNVGWHNHDAGPDFFNGTIKIDGILWTGNIELHVKASDWYAHKHQNDEAYNNVVLHVVYENDMPVNVEGRLLPTLSMKDLIDPSHYESFKSLTVSKSLKACDSVLSSFKEELKEQVQISFFQRIERKGVELITAAETNVLNQYDVLMYSIGQAIGGRLNKTPMQELITGLPIKLIWKEQWDKDRIDAIVFGKAGFLEDLECDYQISLSKDWEILKRKYGLYSMRRSSWKFKGVRPHSFPTRKLAEFSAIIRRLSSIPLMFEDVDQLRSYFDHLIDFELNDFWRHHFTFSKKAKEKQSLSLSKSTKNLILINAFAPFLIYRKHLNGEQYNDDLILDLLESIPSEKNRILKQWNHLGVESENAIDSQGLLELNNEFCIFRKCLSCQVGKSVLGSGKRL